MTASLHVLPGWNADMDWREERAEMVERAPLQIRPLDGSAPLPLTDGGGFHLRFKFLEGLRSGQVPSVHRYR